jgi:hypothetical protein
MIRQHIFFIFILLQFQSIIAQDHSVLPNYDELIKLGDMEYVGGITFFKEKKSENIIAVQNGYVKWSADVIIKCGYRKKRAKIISVFTQSGKLKVKFNNNKVALISIENGEIECITEKKKTKIVKNEIEVMK